MSEYVVPTSADLGWQNLCCSQSPLYFQLSLKKKKTDWLVTAAQDMTHGWSKTLLRQHCHRKSYTYIAFNSWVCGWTEVQFTLFCGLVWLNVLEDNLEKSTMVACAARVFMIVATLLGSCLGRCRVLCHLAAPWAFICSVYVANQRCLSAGKNTVEEVSWITVYSTHRPCSLSL